MLCDDLELGGRGMEPQEEGDVCILRADSCGCMAETNTTWYNNSSVKNRC